MAIYRKDKYGRLIKTAGGLVQRWNDKIFPTNYRFESGSDYYTIDNVANSYITGLTSFTEFKLYIDTPNASENVYIEYKDKTLKLERANGMPVSIGMIEEYLPVYTLDLLDGDKIWYGTDVSYDELSDKPTINDIELIDNKTSKDLKLTGAIHDTEANILLTTGELGTLYYATDTGKIYSWNGTDMYELSSKEYDKLANKPSINSVELSGDKTSQEIKVTGGINDTEANILLMAGETGVIYHATDTKVMYYWDGAGMVVVGSGTEEPGTTNYNDLENKPSINAVELIGDKTLEDLGITGAVQDTETNILSTTGERGVLYFAIDTNVMYYWDGTQMVLVGSGGEGTTNYDDLENKPSINTIELVGDRSSQDLGLSGMVQDTDTNIQAINPGETGVLYFAIDTGKLYYWDTVAMKELASLSLGGINTTPKHVETINEQYPDLSGFEPYINHRDIGVPMTATSVLVGNRQLISNPRMISSNGLASDGWGMAAADYRIHQRESQKVVTNAGNSSALKNRIYTRINGTFKAGDLIYVKFSEITTGDKVIGRKAYLRQNGTSGSLFTEGDTIRATNEAFITEVLTDCTNPYFVTQLECEKDVPTTEPTISYFKGINVYNLTDEFEAGNEPGLIACNNRFNGIAEYGYQNTNDRYLSTGVNRLLLDTSNVNLQAGSNVEIYDDGVKVTSNKTNTFSFVEFVTTLKPNTKYTISKNTTIGQGTGNYANRIEVWDVDKYVDIIDSDVFTFTTRNFGENYIRFLSANNASGDNTTYRNVMLSEGEVALPRQDYKGYISDVSTLDNVAVVMIWENGQVVRISDGISAESVTYRLYDDYYSNNVMISEILKELAKLKVQVNSYDELADPVTTVVTNEGVIDDIKPESLSTLFSITPTEEEISVKITKVGLNKIDHLRFERGAISGGSEINDNTSFRYDSLLAVKPDQMYVFTTNVSDLTILDHYEYHRYDIDKVYLGTVSITDTYVMPSDTYYIRPQINLNRDALESDWINSQIQLEIGQSASEHFTYSPTYYVLDGLITSGSFTTDIYDTYVVEVLKGDISDGKLTYTEYSDNEGVIISLSETVESLGTKLNELDGTKIVLSEEDDRTLYEALGILNSRKVDIDDLSYKNLNDVVGYKENTPQMTYKDTTNQYVHFDLAQEDVVTEEKCSAIKIGNQQFNNETVENVEITFAGDNTSGTKFSKSGNGIQLNTSDIDNISSYARISVSTSCKKTLYPIVVSIIPKINGTPVAELTQNTTFLNDSNKIIRWDKTQFAMVDTDIMTVDITVNKILDSTDAVTVNESSFFTLSDKGLANQNVKIPRDALQVSAVQVKNSAASITIPTTWEDIVFDAETHPQEGTGIVWSGAGTGEITATRDIKLSLFIKAQLDQPSAGDSDAGIELRMLRDTGSGYTFLQNDYSRHFVEAIADPITHNFNANLVRLKAGDKVKFQWQITTNTTPGAVVATTNTNHTAAYLSMLEV